MGFYSKLISASTEGIFPETLKKVNKKIVHRVEKRSRGREVVSSRSISDEKYVLQLGI